MSNKNSPDGLSKQFSRRSFFSAAGVATLVVAGGGATLALSGCASPTTPATPSPGGLVPLNGRYMTASAIILNFVEVLVAQERGFFKELGVEMDIRGGPGTAPSIQALLGDSVDINRTNGINTTIAIANEDAPLVAIGTVFQKSQFELCSLADSPITHPSQLEGKTVGIMSAGGTTENLLDAMLIQSGVDPSTVSRPVTGIGTAVFEMARNGAVDAWISLSGDRALIDSELGKLEYFNIDEFAKLPGDSYNVTQSMIDSGSEMPSRFLAGVLMAMEYASDEKNWDQVVKDLQVYAPDTDTDTALAGMPQLIDLWQSPNGFLSIDEAAWRTGQDILLKIGSLEKSAPVEKMITTKYLDEARAML